MAFTANASLLTTSDMTIITRDGAALQPIQPSPSQETQDFGEALVEEQNLRRELEKDVNWLCGEPCMIIEGLRAHEERVKAHEQIAMRLGESRQTPTNGKIAIQEQKESKELWIKALEDWREWLGQGRKGIKSSKALVLCHERILELQIKLKQDSGSSTEATRKCRQMYMELSISTVQMDMLIMRSENMFIECEETFREWGRQPLLKLADISKKHHDKKEFTNKGRSIEEERRSLEHAKKIVEKEKRGVEEERRRLEQERRSMEKDIRMIDTERRKVREEEREVEDRRMAEADKRIMEDKMRIVNSEKGKIEEMVRREEHRRIEEEHKKRVEKDRAEIDAERRELREESRRLEDRRMAEADKRIIEDKMRIVDSEKRDIEEMVKKEEHKRRGKGHSWNMMRDRKIVEEERRTLEKERRLTVWERFLSSCGLSGQ